jgi:hypothetical protein
LRNLHKRVSIIAIMACIRKRGAIILRVGIRRKDSRPLIHSKHLTAERGIIPDRALPPAKAAAISADGLLHGAAGK